MFGSATGDISGSGEVMLRAITPFGRSLFVTCHSLHRPSTPTMLKAPSDLGLPAGQTVSIDYMRYDVPVGTSLHHGFTANEPSTILADRHQIYNQWIGVLPAYILHPCNLN